MMNASRFRFDVPPAFGASLLALLLAACGSSDDASTVAGPTAVADSATVAWNAPASIDVLANDSAGTGPVALTAVTAPLHGSATIVDGKLNYQPAAGYFGADSLSYTIADATSATATATVAITVQAQMKLQGTVADAPIANAKVTAKVGTAEFAATADASGNYEVAVTSSDGAEFVVVEAVGVGAQSKLRLMSLVGDTAKLAGRATTEGAVPNSAMPELNATHLSTALAVLAARNQGGTMPASADALMRATSGVSGSEMLRLATFIRLVADKGVALPDGVADTLALLQDPARLDAFASQQLSANAATFHATQAEVLADAPLAGQLEAFAVEADVTIVFLPDPLSYGWGMVTYRRDGTASVSVVGTSSRSEAVWTRDGSTITLALDVPVVTQSYAPNPDPETGEQYLVEDTVTGYVLRHLLGDSRSGTASIEARGSQVFLEGPHIGQPTPESDTNYGKPLYAESFLDLDQRLEIEAADVAAGARLGGVIVGFPGDGAPQAQADILRIDSATAATLEASGQGVTWSLADRWLVLTRPSGERVRHARLARDASNGLETWIAVAQEGDRDAAVIVSHAVRADPAPDFDAASATRTWRFEDGYRSDPSYEIIYRIYGDGSGMQDTVVGGVSQGGRSMSWSIDAQSRVAMQRLNGDGSVNQHRAWRRLKVQGPNVIVLEFLGYSGSSTEGNYRLRWLTDLGPATKS